MDYNLEDNEDDLMQPAPAGATVDPNEIMKKEQYLQSLRDRLISQGEGVAEGQNRRALTAGLLDSAAQIGSFQGKVADTSSFHEFQKAMDAANKDRFERQNKLYEGDQKGLQGLKTAAQRASEGELNRKAHKENARIIAQGKLSAAELKAQEDAANKADKKSEGEKLPAAQVAELGDMKSVEGLIDNLGSSWDKNASETGSGLSQVIPGSEANLYNVDRGVAVSAVAKAIEGRAPTDSDMLRYDPMFPKATDTLAQKQQKINALKAYAKSRLEERKKAFSAYGYKNPDLSPQPSPTPAPTPGLESTGRSEVKRMYSPSRNQTKVMYNDGSEEILEGKK